MRIFHFTLATSLFALSAGSILLACGGSSSTGAAGGIDASTPIQGDATTVVPSDAGTKDSAPQATNDASTPAIDAGPCAAPSAAGFATAAHGALPDMVYGGGGILTAPRVITVTFSDSFEPAQVAAFGATITQTPWFAEVTKDYCVDDGGTCVHGGTTGSAIALDASAGNTTWVDNSVNPNGGVSSAGQDFTPFLLEQVAAITPGGIAAVDPNAIYTFYFPRSTIFFLGDPNQGGTPGCGFGGYHNAVGSLPDGGGAPVTYAVILDCSYQAPADQELAGLTITTSHELVEATTDPYPGGGWYLDQDENELDAGLPTPPNLRNQGWANADQFGEIGDNCESLIDPTWTLDGGAQVQRIWSISAAAAGENPCVPVPPGETYYNATPDKAVYVAAVGSTFTVDVTGFSPTARPGWSIQGYDGTPTQLPDGGTNSPLLKLEFVGGVDPAGVAPGGSELQCFNNGASAQLKVTLLSDPAQDPAINNSQIEPLWQEADGLLVSLDTTQQPQTFGGSIYYPYQLWPFAVVTPATAAEIGLTSTGLGEDERQKKGTPHEGRPGLHHPRIWERSRRRPHFVVPGTPKE